MQQTEPRKLTPKMAGDPAPPVRLPRAGPRSVSRGLEVLRLISAAPLGLNLTEIATGLRLPKTSVLNVLRSLNAESYIASEGGKYVLGGSALSLAAAMSSTVSFPSSLLPRFRAFAEATGETVTLGTYSEDGRSVIYIEVIESRHGLRLSRSRGSASPIHATSVGQALLAFMPEPLVQSLLSQRKLTAPTKHTITRSELVEKLPQIRKTATAKNVSGLDEGIVGVGSPVFDATGTLRCAIATGGPIGRLRPRLKEITAIVRTTAEEMSRILGYQGVYPPPVAEPAKPARAPRSRSPAK
ncbi:MAG: hypothetical protein JWQ97_399 [Phenylobacterium sp.]|nr:hypothetical protein [Phenylobacterium sp.]